MKVTQDRGRGLGSSPSSVTNLKGGCHLSDPRTLFSAGEDDLPPMEVVHTQ